MIIYKDRITGHELCSDSFKIEEKGDGAVFEVQCRLINKSAENNFDIGANASAEEAEEDLATESNEVIDVVDAFGLEPAPPYLYDELESSKKKNKGKPREEQEIKTEYFKKLGEYLKKVQQKMKDDGASAEATKKFATAAQGWYNSNIKPDLEKFELFQHPADAEFEGMIVLCERRSDGPYLTYWKHGLDEEKV